MSQWIALAVIVSLASLVSSCAKMHQKSAKPCKFEWFVSSYELFPSLDTKKLFEKDRKYIRQNAIATRFQWNPLLNHVFVVHPRYKVGVPSTLNRAIFNKGKTPVFRPYPNLEMQQEGNCSAIQSAVDLFLDKKGRLWVLDSGVVHTLSCQPLRLCSPRVHVFCTLTHRTLLVIDLGELILPHSRLQYMAVERTPLGHTFVYISDAGTQSLIIWNVKKKCGERIMLPPSASAGGKPSVLYLTLVRTPHFHNVHLFFKYLESDRLYSIRTDLLRAKEYKRKPVKYYGRAKNVVLLGSQGDKLYLRHRGSSNVHEWKTSTKLKRSSFTRVYKGDKSRMPTHVAIGRKFTMYGLESNLQDFIHETTGSLGAYVSLFPLNTKPQSVISSLVL